MQCHIYFEQTTKATKTLKAKKNKQTVWVSPSSQTDNQEKAANQHGLSPFFPLAMLDEWPLYQQTNKQTLFLEEFYTMKLLARWWWRGVGSHGDDEHITNGSGVKKREKKAAEGAIRTKGNQTRAIVREGMERGKMGHCPKFWDPPIPPGILGHLKNNICFVVFGLKFWDFLVIWSFDLFAPNGDNDVLTSKSVNLYIFSFQSTSSPPH